MPASQVHVGHDTPMGANLVADGATFRAWAPRAISVHVVGSFNGWIRDDASLLVDDGRGYWAGFVAGVNEGDEYKFHVVGRGGENDKRDPYARELTLEPKYPHCNCIVRDPAGFPWHDAGFRPPAFHDLVIYQLHVGTFLGSELHGRVGVFLDVLEKLDHLKALGVNAVEPLPVTEFIASPRSKGYDGADLFSPEMDYQVRPDAPDFPARIARVDALYRALGLEPPPEAVLASGANQLRAVVDLLHLHGLAVIFDVVYNHAGSGVEDQAESLWFFDEFTDRSNRNNSLYFTDQNETGPVFASWNAGVRGFLIDNAQAMLQEYHVDGFRYDHARILIDKGGDGWGFWQDLTDTARWVRPAAVQVAEFWPVDPNAVRPTREGGAGFDATWYDGFRQALRGLIAQASAQGAAGPLPIGRVAATLRAKGLPAAWKAVQYVESHDEAKRDGGDRVARLADPVDARSWYARSRSRVANGLVLTAPGIPLLFMGQEFLEDKRWDDNPDTFHGTELFWDGLATDRAMADHLRFTRELVALRRRHPGLRGEDLHVFLVNEADRILGFHRWAGDSGRDVVVVASLAESTRWGYRIGFPGGGFWREVFNADVYDHWVNPIVAGNGWGVTADGPPWNDMPASAEIVVPANGLLVFGRDAGDRD